MKTFDVHIDLGNEAMRTPHDVADTLERLSQRLRQGDAASGKLADLNGNTVGEFGFDLDRRSFAAAAYDASREVKGNSPLDDDDPLQGVPLS